MFSHLVQRLLPVRGGANHVDAGEPAEQQDEAFADAGLVVGHDDAQRCGPGGVGGDGHDVTSCGRGAGARGSSAVTAHWPSRGPATKVPFSNRSRSGRLEEEGQHADEDEEEGADRPPDRLRRHDSQYRLATLT